MTFSRRDALLTLAACASLFPASTTASAQAFLPNAGEGSVSVLFQQTLVDRHLISDGSRVDAGRIMSDAVLVDLTYGVTDGTTISVSLPFMTARYEGSKPHPGSPLDDGRYHSSFQDFRFDIRRSLTRGPLAVTPFIGTILPSHDYQYYGHGAVGRDLKEVQVGAYVARLLDPLIPGAFVQGRYSYGFMEHQLNVSHNRSIMDLELGYFVNPSVRVFALATGQISHGGIELTRLFPTDLTAAEFLHHDQISDLSLFDAGGGLQFSVTPSLDLFTSVLHTMSGRNGHAVTYNATIGATWSFQGKALGRTHATHSLVKCLCDKGK